MKKKAKRKLTQAEARKFFDDLYARVQAKETEFLKTPEGNAARLAENIKRLKKVKKNPAPKISVVLYAVTYKPPGGKARYFWTGKDTVTSEAKDAALFRSQSRAEKAASHYATRVDPKHRKFIGTAPV